jgi:hypothetical protein
MLENDIDYYFHLCIVNNGLVNLDRRLSKKTSQQYNQGEQIFESVIKNYEKNQWCFF